MLKTGILWNKKIRRYRLSPVPVKITIKINIYFDNSWKTINNAYNQLSTIKINICYTKHENSLYIKYKTPFNTVIYTKVRSQQQKT